jgi:hypothetical protein
VTLVQSSWLNDVDTATYSYLTATAGTNTITATGPVSQTAYAAGQIFRFIPANTNTGATTLNVSNLGAKSIFLRGAALVGGELFKNQPAEVMYDGTQFNIVGNSAIPAVPRSFLAGLTMSTAGGSATMSVAAGQATDSTNAVVMNLASAISKTTSAWAVGTGNGGKLTAGAVANSTWYHFYEIFRSDTSVVDVGFDISATVATLPSGYTHYRRIGSGLTNGSAQWVAFTQDGDFFQWSTPVLDISVTSAGTSAVTRTLASVPSGVNVNAFVDVNCSSTASLEAIYLSDLATADLAPSSAAAPLTTVRNHVTSVNNSVQAVVRTNTSQQIRSRSATGGATESLAIATLGWWDFRGKNS